MNTHILVGKDEKLNDIELPLAVANRHGLITGATGTGKTVTLQRLAEQFSRNGISVFTADVKGDLSGLAVPGSLDNSKVKERLADLKVTDFTPAGNPVVFWDIYGQSGHPLRATLSELGPLLLGHLLNLNDVQQGVLQAAFSLADDQGLLLLDLKDIRSLLDWMSSNADTLKTKYGNINASSIGAIQRGLITFESAGGNLFFGEPAFAVANLFQKDASGKGLIHVLDASKLINNPLLYCTFLLWLLSDLFETMPEVGDISQPKLAFFFDEAHLLFDSAPKPLLDKIEQLVRLIRSKGVGVYFVTQSPLDVPDNVLGQLGNRVQHALRGFTPKDQKAIKAAAQTFRQNPNLNTEEVIMQLGVGEALVSFLGSDGVPAMVEKVNIMPPESRVGVLSEAERKQVINQSPFAGMYDKAIDRESAYEVLSKRTAAASEESAATTTEKRPAGRPRQSVTQAIITSTARSFGTQVGRQILRGIMGSIFGKGR